VYIPSKEELVHYSSEYQELAEYARSLNEINQRLSDALDKALGENEQMKAFIRQFDTWQDMSITDFAMAYEVWKARQQLDISI